jgi:hypothetical protein
VSLLADSLYASLKDVGSELVVDWMVGRLAERNKIFSRQNCGKSIH